MTDTLAFRYTVAEGDEVDTFDILDTRTAKRQRFSTALVRPAAAEVRVAEKEHRAHCSRRNTIACVPGTQF